MLTIEQAANEHTSGGWTDDKIVSFKAGAAFAQRWIPVEEELPLAYISGNWDGLKSDFVIVKFKNGDWTKAVLYSGTMDGSEFNDWYCEQDYQISNITHWRPITIE